MFDCRRCRIVDGRKREAFQDMRRCWSDGGVIAAVVGEAFRVGVEVLVRTHDADGWWSLSLGQCDTRKTLMSRLELGADLKRSAKPFLLDPVIMADNCLVFGVAPTRRVVVIAYAIPLATVVTAFLLTALAVPI